MEDDPEIGVDASVVILPISIILTQLHPHVLSISCAPTRVLIGPHRCPNGNNNANKKIG